MDDADIAQIRQERELDSLLSARDVPIGDSADCCAVCGELIPSARQIAVPGCQACVECAQWLERQMMARRGGWR